MVSQGLPSRSIVAIAEPSSAPAEALPTPCSRKVQAMSVPAVPGGIVSTAQAREIASHRIFVPHAAQLQQRPLQTRQVALAPTGFRDAYAPTVEIDPPAVAGGAEQDVVCVE